jgi:hypothetical protein
LLIQPLKSLKNPLNLDPFGTGSDQPPRLEFETGKKRTCVEDLRCLNKVQASGPFHTQRLLSLEKVLAVAHTLLISQSFQTFQRQQTKSPAPA